METVAGFGIFFLQAHENMPALVKPHMYTVDLTDSNNDVEHSGVFSAVVSLVDPGALEHTHRLCTIKKQTLSFRGFLRSWPRPPKMA